MSWVHLYEHDSYGKILGKRSASEHDMAAYKDVQGLVTEQDVNHEEHYVRDGKLVPYPVEVQLPWFEFDHRKQEVVYLLDQAKEYKWQEIKTKRSKAEFGSLLFRGDYYDIDEKSQRRIQTAVTTSLIDPTAVFNWTTAENVVVMLTSSDMQELGKAISAHASACHAKSQTLRVQISAARSARDIEQIRW